MCTCTYMYICTYTCCMCKVGPGSESTLFPGACVLERQVCSLKALNTKKLGDTHVCLILYMGHTRIQDLQGGQKGRPGENTVINDGLHGQGPDGSLATHLRWEQRHQFTVAQSKGTALIRSSCRGFILMRGLGRLFSYQDSMNLGKQFKNEMEEGEDNSLQNTCSVLCEPSHHSHKNASNLFRRI